MRSDDHVTHNGQPTDGLDRTAPAQHDAAEQHDAPEQHDAAPLPVEPTSEQHHAAEHKHPEHPHHDPDAHRHHAGHGCGHHDRHGFGREHGHHDGWHGFGHGHGHGHGEQLDGSAPGFGPREHGFGHREHGFGPHRRGFGHGGRGRPALARSIVKSARRIRNSGLTPEQLQHRIATTVSHADYVTTMRTLRRIGMDLRHQR